MNLWCDDQQNVKYKCLHNDFVLNNTVFIKQKVITPLKVNYVTFVFKMLSSRRQHSLQCEMHQLPPPQVGEMYF